MSEDSVNPGPGTRWRSLRRRSLAVGLACCVLLWAGLFWRAQRDRPSHQGRSLDAYLVDLARPPGSGSYQVASNAVFALGTNALPVLLRNIRQPAPLHIRLYMRYQTNLPVGWRRSLHKQLDPYRYLNRRPGAFHAVTLLGTNAAPLAEALVTIFGEGRLEVQHDIAQVLPRLGPASVPRLKAFLTHTNLRTRGLATFVMHQLGASSAPAAPELVAGLAGADTNHERLIVQTLGRMGAGALPVVTNLLTGTDERERMVGIKALAGLLPRAWESTPVVLAMLEDASPTVRLNAAILIVDWWPVFGDEFAASIQALPAGHPWRARNQLSLELLTAKRQEVIRTLREGLQTEDPDLQLEVLSRLVRINVRDDAVLARLRELRDKLAPQSHEGWRVEALLRETGQSPVLNGVRQMNPRPGMVPAAQPPP